MAFHVAGLSDQATRLGNNNKKPQKHKLSSLIRKDEWRSLVEKTWDKAVEHEICNST
jgi:hypothetical protein